MGDRVLTLRELNRATLQRQLLLGRTRLSPTALELPERVADRSGGEHGAGRRVEGREELVTRRVELSALELGELPTDDGAMPLEQLPPGESPSRDAGSVEPTMSVKRRVASTLSEPTRSVRRDTKPSAASIVAR